LDTNSIFKTLTKSVKFFAGKMPECHVIATKLRDDVAAFKPFLPLVAALRTPGMEERHWDALSEKLGVKVPDPAANPAFTLTVATEELGLSEHVAIIEKVSEAASKEYGLKKTLDEMTEAWEEVLLQVDPYRATGTYIMKGVDEYMALLDEQITKTQAMTFSTFKGPYAETIDDWNAALLMTSEVIDEWVAVQRNWMYLAPIFAS
jgi:dynein heavy chain